MEHNTTLVQQYLVCRIDAIVFKAEDDTSCILAVSRDNGKKCRVIGDLKNPIVGSVVSAEGAWARHEKFGWQFKASVIRLVSEKPEDDDRTCLRCTVSDNKVLKGDTGFCVAHGTDETGEAIRLSGKLNNIKADSKIFCIGRWEDSERYGKEFKVSRWEFVRAGRTGSLQRAYDFIQTIQTEQKARESVVEIPWNEVRFRDYLIIIPGKNGGHFGCPFPDAREAYETLKPMLVDRVEMLKVIYDESGKPQILNTTVLRDAISVMSVRHKLNFTVPAQARVDNNSGEILDIVSGMEPETTKAFVPRDMTPYLEFLQKSQEPMYGVVPVVEFNGGSKEDAFLFTISINGKPCIVWENVNDARATFVFESDEDDYNRMLQLVVDFIGDGHTRKRQYLHSEQSAELFGKRPRCVVHNDLESWSSRLINTRMNK